MTAEQWLTPTDLRLLRTLQGTPNLVRAAHRLGIPRDRAVYRLERLRRLYGKPAAIGRRGGGKVGATTLTPLGRALVRRAQGAHRGANRWEGTYQLHPSPHVDLGKGYRLAVTFHARPASSATIEVDPESFVVARAPFESSARNVLPVVVERVRSHSEGRVVLGARWGPFPVRATLTSGSVRRLRLGRGQPAYFLLKAVAIRKV